MVTTVFFDGAARRADQDGIRFIDRIIASPLGIVSIGISLC